MSDGDNVERVVPDGVDTPEERPTGEPAEVLISKLDSWSVHRICSGQVIISLAVAVKELVENALDAGAKDVVVRTKEFGAKSIEVQDNGEGILPENFESLCLKHFTSKLREFSDLERIATFGFRGEALSSLCALGQVSVVTKHTSADVASELRFNTEGRLAQNKPCARDTGTTICVENIFATLPVRHKQFMSTLKKEFSKMVNFISGYCLITRGVSMSVVNIDDSGRRHEVLRKRAHLSYRDNIAEVFGYKEVSKLVAYEPAPIPLDDEIVQEFRLSKLGLEYFQEVVIEGLISSCAHGKGRSTGDRQFFFVNSRPCDLVKLTKMVNQVYHQFNNSQQPFVMLNILTPQQLVDVNLTPDKRTVLLHRENVMLAMIKASLLAMFNKQATQYTVNDIEGKSQTYISQSYSNVHGERSADCDNVSLLETSGEVCANVDAESTANTTSFRENADNGLHDFRARFSSSNNEQTSHGSHTRRTSAALYDRGQKQAVGSTSTQKSGALNLKDRFSFQASSSKRKLQDSELPAASAKAKRTIEPAPLSSFGFTRALGTAHKDANLQSDKIDKRRETLMRSLEGRGDKPSGTHIFLEKPASETPAFDDHSVNLLANTSMNGKERFNNDAANDSHQKLNATGKDFAIVEDETTTGHLGVSEDTRFKSAEDNNVSTTDANPVDSESTVVDDLTDRKVGVCKLNWTFDYLEKDFEAILAEEAAREESSSTTCRFRARISPKENSSAESELIREVSKDTFGKMEIIGQFNKGFIVARMGNDLFIVDQHAADEKFNFETLQATTVIDTQPLAVPQKLELAPGSEQTIMEHLSIFEKNGFRLAVDNEAPWGHRLALSAVPQSGQWQMGMPEIDELIFMLSDNTHPNIGNCRPAKVRAMFAMRACRKSVMVGDELSRRDMKRVVGQLSGLQHPWNCPHGRPTMRHLVNLSFVNV